MQHGAPHLLESAQSGASEYTIGIQTYDRFPTAQIIRTPVVKPVSTWRGERGRRSPLDVDMASKTAKEEDDIDITERLDDEIRGPVYAVRENAKHDILEATDSIVLPTAEVPSQGVIGQDFLRCLMGAHRWSRLMAGGGGVSQFAFGTRIVYPTVSLNRLEGQGA